jgi:hypothetical protein
MLTVMDIPHGSQWHRADTRTDCRLVSTLFPLLRQWRSPPAQSLVSQLSPSRVTDFSHILIVSCRYLRLFVNSCIRPDHSCIIKSVECQCQCSETRLRDSRLPRQCTYKATKPGYAVIHGTMLWCLPAPEAKQNRGAGCGGRSGSHPCDASPEMHRMSD